MKYIIRIITVIIIAPFIIVYLAISNSDGLTIEKVRSDLDVKY